MPVQSNNQIRAPRTTTEPTKVARGTQPYITPTKAEMPREVSRTAKNANLGAFESSKNLANGGVEFRYSSASITRSASGELSIKAQPKEVASAAKQHNLGTLQSVYETGDAKLYFFEKGSVEHAAGKGLNQILKQHAHTVKPGETLNQIAKHYGVDPRFVADMSSVKDPNKIQVGQQLFVSKQQVVINPGDTLSKLAKTFYTDVATLKKLNDIQDVNKITAGQLLVVPDFVGC